MMFGEIRLRGLSSADLPAARPPRAERPAGALRREAQWLAPLVVVLALIVAVAVLAWPSGSRHQRDLHWRYDGQHLTWDWRHAPNEIVHFDVRLPGGGRIDSSFAADQPAHFEPQFQCGPQEWSVYVTAGHPLASGLANPCAT